MAFEASDYTIWMVFILLETLAFRFCVQPELKPIRYFMGLCLIRDFILLAWSCHLKDFWLGYWIGQAIELTALALIAGYMIGPSRGWRISGFAVAALSAHYAYAKHWPVTALPEEIFHFERNCSLIILATLLIGAVFTFGRKQLPLAGAVATLALADMVSAQSFLLGNYSPRTASVVWAVGLGILVAAAKANPGYQRIPSPSIQARAASTIDNHSSQLLQPPSEATLLDEASRLAEWLTSPCHTQLQ